MDTKFLKGFRAVASSYSKTFENFKNHIRILLGPNQNLWSGIFREGLIKNVLRQILPDAVSIDSGFIYGYGQIKNSKQLDIIIWDSLRHSAIYRTKDFVIISPESAIAVISVKSKATKRDLIDGLDNLFSIIPLDLKYRYNFKKYFPNASSYRPIDKFLVCYDGVSNNIKNIIKKSEYISNFYIENVSKNSKLTKFIFDMTEESNFYGIPDKKTKANIENISRIYPRQICAIESKKFSFYSGLGSIKQKGEQTKGKGWGPCLYPQKSEITSPFEKLIYYILQGIYVTYNVDGIPILSAWGDIDPSTGFSGIDVSEIDIEKSFRLINPSTFR